MKTRNNLRLLQYLLLFILTLCALSTYAQLELVPIPREQAPHLKKNSSARTQAVAPRKLPFWDDFSFANKSFVQDSLWFSGQSVWINNGMGINPPSLGVATFDGLDSLGKPYNVNDVLAKGFADNITSQPLRMDLIDPSLRASVFISFFYQFQGNGEAPDQGDSIFLQFKNVDKQWETVWSQDNDGTLDKSVFTEVILPVRADRFYHEGFQFRFRNYARLSGPYDTWNLDYIYTNLNRINPSDTIPDRTISKPLSSLFKKYYSIPIKHFFQSPEEFLDHAGFSMFNLRFDLDQVANYYTYFSITNYIQGVPEKDSVTLDVFESVRDLSGSVTPIPSLQQLTSKIKTLPPVNLFNPLSDSIDLKLKLALTTKDNLPPDQNGDYDISKYAPIDFRVNDTTETRYFLKNYYAYDDGSAEYGASLKGAGAQLMYKFDKNTKQADALIGVYLYFPRFGAASAQTIQLQVMKDLLGSGSSQLYSETMTITLSQQDKFIYHPIPTLVPIDSGSFYVGWKQSTSTNVVIGIDKNTDTGSNIYFNTNGSWEQNILTRGSLMIRPAFGDGGEIVGLPEEKYVSAYPNPNNGTFFLSPDASNINIIDITGKSVSFTTESNTDNQQIKIQSAVMGMYILRFVLNEKIITQKIIVKQ